MARAVCLRHEALSFRRQAADADEQTGWERESEPRLSAFIEQPLQLLFMASLLHRRVQDVIIISDLHLAVDNQQPLFQADAQLAAFLNCVREATPHTTLVLNGDILDFLAASQAGEQIKAFDPLTAPTRTQQIIAAHPLVFDALAKLRRFPQHELVILGGNHDPELALPAVRHVIEQHLGVSESHPRLTWLVHGEAAAFQIGPARVLVEHGDALDAWNYIKHGRLLSAIKRATRGLDHTSEYTPPPGSHLVVNHLNAVRADYPWVDMLKPEFDAVVPILHKFLPVEQQLKLLESLDPWLSLLGRTLKTHLNRFFTPASQFRADSEAASEEYDSRMEFAEWVRQVQAPPARGQATATPEEELIELLKKAAERCHFFQFGHDAEPRRFFGFTLPRAGQRFLEYLFTQGHDLIVHGHTHAAKAYPLRGGLYLNSGTWGQLMKLPAPEAANWPQFCNELRAGRAESFRRPTFVRVCAEAATDSTQAALQEWQEDGTVHTHAAFRFSSLSRAWEAAPAPIGDSLCGN